MKLGIFPLPIYLLPQGITRLSIFEARYKRLVKKALQEQGFILSLYVADNAVQSSQYGVWVDIIDFNLTDNGLLSIDIKAKSLVKLNNFSYEDDGLLLADVQLCAHWSEKNIDHNKENFNSDKREQEIKLSKALRQIFDQVPQLNALYPQTYFDNRFWVCARFIESLPLSLEQKQPFYHEKSFEQCLEFLDTVINGESIHIN